MKVKRICLWSGPRNVSTALMYGFAQRSDTRVVDEPLYGHYLRVSGADHPGRRDVMAAMDCDGDRVVREVILGPCDRPILFMKQMAHHLVGIDTSFLSQTDNVLLIRDPAEMLPSLAKNLPVPELADTGLAVQTDLFRRFAEMGRDPIVLDARRLLLDPQAVLGGLCDRLSIQFSDSMLTWPPGPRPEDGVWAPHWYENVHRSTGFQPYRPKTDPFPDRLARLLEACRPHYEMLLRSAIGSESQSRDGDRRAPDATAP